MRIRALTPLAALLAALICLPPASGQGISASLSGQQQRQVTVVPFPGNLYAPSTALGRLGVAVAQAPVAQSGRASARTLRRIAVGAGAKMVPGLRGVVEAEGLHVTRITTRSALLPSLRKVKAEAEVDRLWSTIEGFRGTDGAVYTARYVGQDHMYSAWVEGTLVIVQQEHTGAFLVFHVQEYGE